MKNVIIVGAGGFGREVFYWLQDWIDFDANRRHSFQIKGFLGLDESELDSFDLPVGILGNEETYEFQKDDLFVMAVGQPALKRKIATRMIELKAEFFTLVHPTAIVCSSAKIGVGVVLCPFSTVSSDVEIGNFAMLNANASVGHDCKVGDFCVLSGYANLNGFVTLEDEVFLGTRATVVASKTVGAQSNVSAHALVVSDVPRQTTVLSAAGRFIPNLN